MTAHNVIAEHIADHHRTVESVLSSQIDLIDAISRELARSLAQGGTLFWCGNGGSAADSQHLAAEFVGRFKKDRRALRSVALTTDTSVLTCVGNDYSYEDVFARQLDALGRPGDVLIGISTSGNSENVLRALKAAKDMGLGTVALLGKDGGRAKQMAGKALVVSSESTARIQEAHILIGHILCDLIERELGLV